MNKSTHFNTHYYLLRCKINERYYQLKEQFVLEVRQAYTQQLLKTIQLDSADDIEKKLTTAHLAHLTHRQGLPAHRRIKILDNLIHLMAKEQNDFAKLIASEGGKPLTDAKVEVSRAIDGIKIAITEIRATRGKQIPMDLTTAGEGRVAWTTPEPIGVVVAVSAFNHPLNLIVHQVVPAIAVGCPIIVKPADVTPLCCLRFVQLAHKAGLAKDWLQASVCAIPEAEKLVTDNRVAFFSFIGSAKVGWYLRSKLSPGTRCALEHGGAAPLIYDDFANNNAFVSGVIRAGFYHSGQVCVSVQRIFVPNNKVKDIAKQIANKADKLVVGDAINEDTEVGPLILPREVDRVASWVDEALNEGAELLCGGKKLSPTTYAPTVLLNPNPNSKVSIQEIFGPVVCVYGYDNLSDVIKAANGLEVAFQASIFTDNIHFAHKVAKQLDASAVMINDYSTFRTDWMPFAGRRHSGYGVGGIGYTMADMTEDKMLVINTNH